MKPKESTLEEVFRRKLRGLPEPAPEPVYKLTEEDWAAVKEAIANGRFDDYDSILNELLDIPADDVRPEDDEAWELRNRVK